ncbi:MAG: hypothetical protein KAT00_07770 [Planctomycetes bacterium]|nr:hypothetical protein [Planctomycetota bacterium]
MNNIHSYDVVLNSIYSGMYARIDNLVTRVLLDNADQYTGKSAAQSSLSTAVATNKVYADNVSDGVSLVQTNQSYVSSISDKLSTMKQLAEDVASGGYTATQVAEMQLDLANLVDDIDAIADGAIGETHLLTADNGTVEVDIGNGLVIDIDTHDLTDSGLAIDNLDLTTDAAGAVIAIDAAIAEVDSYSTSLTIKADALESSAAILEAESDSLLAVQSGIERIDAALMIVSLLAASTTSSFVTFLATQANITSQTALGLLSVSV